MNPSRRVFYVIYSKDEHEQSILDAIRFLAEPTEKTRAHVTIRGPYRQKYALSAASKGIDGSEVEVTGVDAFLEAGQNTVFFSLSAPAIERFWHKPDFDDYRPHLTIYDGKSRDFASRLRARLDQIKPRFWLRATPLSPLVACKGQGSLELRASYDADLVNQLTGYRVPVDEVAELPDEKRIDLIAKLCSRLNKNASCRHM